MLWDEQTVSRLRQYWDEGLSGRQIGVMLGCNKNTISGKANRLKLPERPELRLHVDPAIREMIVMFIKAGLNSAYIVKHAATNYRTVARIREQLMLALPEPSKPLPACIVPIRVVQVVQARTCQYPMWADGEKPKYHPDGRMLVCDGPRSRGSYCADHARDCYSRAAA